MRNEKKAKIHVPFWCKLCASVLCAVTVALTVGDGVELVSAASSNTDSAIAALQAESERLQKQNEDRKQQISGLKGDISGNKEAMQLVTDQINGINDEVTAKNNLITQKIDLINERSDEIDAIILTIADKEQEIENKKDEITDLREENKQNLDKFAKLARAIYMKNSSDMMPVLNGSDDWYDYFVYSDVVKNISGQNVLFMQRLQNSIKQQETLIEELDKSIAKLQTDKDDLEKEKAEFEQQKAELEQEKEQLNAYANEQRTYLNSLAAKNSQLQSQVNSLQIKINENNKEIEKNNREIDRIIKEALDENKDQTVYNDGFLWPVSGNYRKITCNYGYDSWRGGMHTGVDIVGNQTDQIHLENIYAAQSGTVIVASNTCTHYNKKTGYDRCGNGYGNYIVIDHGGGITTLYGHCEKLNVTKGQKVTKGDVIGLVGTTGWSTGYHLHFEVRKNNKTTNPKSYTYQYKY